MLLASEDIVIRLEADRITLHPSLRAALRLARKYQTFAPVMKGIAEGNLTIMAELIVEGTAGQRRMASVLSRIARIPVIETLAAIQPPLTEFVLTLAGVDEADLGRPSASEQQVPFVEHFEGLFSIATGMLGWTPDEAWKATPAEIIAAHKGRIDLLQMIFGSGDKQPQKQLSLDEKAKLAFSTIGTRKVAA